jgi:hypothetical protein
MAETTTNPPAGSVKDRAIPSPQVATYALDPTEVQTGTPNGPGIWVAPALTPLPADTMTPFASPWEILGYLSADGPTLGQATTTNELIPWQSAVPLKSVVTKRDITMKFILWQINSLTVAMYFDADIPVPATDGSFEVDVLSNQQPHINAIAIDAMDGSNVIRVGFTRAMLSATGDMTIKRGEAVPMECTLTALDDAGVMAKVLVGQAA